MKIDPRSHVPIYLQIASGIREAVAAGIYPPGESLPSLRVLALEVQVNPNTVQKAYDELSREGLVYSSRGRGLFVSEQGLAGALARAKTVAQDAFEQAIRASQTAGLNTEETRDLFEACLSAKTQQHTQQENTEQKEPEQNDKSQRATEPVEK